MGYIVTLIFVAVVWLISAHEQGLVGDWVMWILLAVEAVPVMFTLWAGRRVKNDKAGRIL